MKVHESGDPAGEAVVFLHGGNVAGWMWGMQLPAFEDYRQLVPDLPGFGESNDEPWVSIADTGDRVAELIAERAPDGAHLVGLSLGSSVALEVAAQHPELVRSLFLASAQVAPPRRRSMLLAGVMLRFWEQRGFWTSTARSYGLRGEDADLFVETGLGIRRETALAIYDEIARGTPAGTLARVAAPTIAVAGGRDSAAIHRDSLDRLRAEVPHALVAIAPGMHHQWNIEDVELFNAALRSWLTSREVSPLLTAR
jgi:pimeloyl-ACP methyl ester carboxylesterase